MNFNQYNSISDIKNLSNNSENESFNFELKGGKKLDKNVKKLLAKEICAFANTYGGVLCYHYGEDSNILGFPSEKIDTEFKSLETWLRDSLEPKILGIDLKITDDGLFLINIPESKTKPHRSTIDSIYYYRHSTISQKMPEIMISAMYKSSDYLSIQPNVIFNKSGNPPRQFSLGVFIKNLSNISGTKPKVQIQIYTKINSNLFSLGDLKYYEKIHNGTSGYLIPDFVDYGISCFSTNIEFSKLILYPKDTLSFFTYTNINDTLKDIKYALIKIDCMFMETERKVDYFFFSYKENKTERVMGTDKNSSVDVINKAKELFNKEEKEKL